MRLGVISDTHGHSDYTRAALGVLDEQQVDALIHCGDIGPPQIVGLFAGRPTHFVFGNTDQDLADLRMAIAELGLNCHEHRGDVELGGRRIGFLHGDDAGAFMEMIASQQFDLVCYGHTHQKELHQQGRTWVLNPGAVYRASPHTVAVVDLETMDIQHVVIEQVAAPGS
jgi:uncharacterized protein